jgi:uncharacterized protein (DUF1778 family)
MSMTKDNRLQIRVGPAERGLLERAAAATHVSVSAFVVQSAAARIEKTVGMRGSPDQQLAMLTSLSAEELIPADHPIRKIRTVVDTVLVDLDDTFEAMYASGGRRSVPPETLVLIDYRREARAQSRDAVP